MTSGNRFHDTSNSIFCGAKRLCPTENRSWLVLLVASPAELHVGRVGERSLMGNDVYPAITEPHAATASKVGAGSRGQRRERETWKRTQKNWRRLWRTQNGRETSPSC